MTPKDIRIALANNRRFEESVHKSTHRTWPLDAIDPGNEYANLCVLDDVVVKWSRWASFYVSFWGDEVLPPQVAVTVASARGGYGDEIGRLSASDLRKIAAMKQIYEDWLSGKIPELPIELPPDILNLP